MDATSGNSWVYLFSRFTPEALLFEALALFTLIAIYAGYWLVKKKNRGAADEIVPANVIKGYLNDLIFDAENLRAQLFGLLKSAHADPNLAAAGAAQITAVVGQMIQSDPALLKKVQELEAKMAEQAAALAALLAEKDKLMKELEAARNAANAGTPAPASGGPDRSAEISELEAKIAALEAKLAEYSIIEDDLANLKRLQQENAQLKSALGGAAPTAAAPQPAPHAAAPEPQAAAPAPQPAAPQPAPSPAFEAVVDKVEESLKADAPAPAAAAPAAEPAKTEQPAQTAQAAAPAAEKTDADLVQEFEKMLNA